MTNDCYTISELLERNGGEYPFWVTNCEPRHYVAKVTGFVFIPWQPSINDRPWRKSIKAQFPDSKYEVLPQNPTTYYVCDVYLLNDRTEPFKKNVHIPSHDVPSWLPA